MGDPLTTALSVLAVFGVFVVLLLVVVGLTLLWQEASGIDPARYRGR